MDLLTFLQWSVFICFIYLIAVNAAFLLMLIGSALEHRLLVRCEQTEDYETLAQSRFTIPVSVIAPAFNEALVIESSVKSMLELQYPEFEIIVVNDGSSDDTLGVLQRGFDLERREVFYRRQFASAPIRGVYRSRRFPNLIVVDKENGRKADALNAGLNLAKYRYICTVDSDTVYSPNALLHSMREPVRDPANIVGVTSGVTINRRPEEAGFDARIDDGVLTNFQMLDYLRAFLNNRLGWTRWNFMLCSVGAFAIWRRDLVVELRGFSGAFTCEDIEFTFRAHEHFRQQGKPYKIVALQESVGKTEGPDTIWSLVSQRARWQRVITETVWQYRRMFLNPKYGSTGMVGVPYYVLVEVLAPIFQVLAVLLVPLAWWLGVLDPMLLLLVLLATALVNGAFTNAAILFNDRGGHSYPTGDLVRLMILGVGDLFVYRPILFFAQAKGLIDFLRGDKAWHKFERNRRTPTA